MATFDLWWQHGLCEHWTYLLCLQESGQTGECRHVSVRTVLTLCSVCCLCIASSDPGISHRLSEAEEQLHTALRSPVPAPLAAPLWPGQDPGPWWLLTTECPIFPPWSPVTSSHRALVTKIGLTCVTLTGDWAGAGARNEIIIDVITISGVNIATRINSSEALNWIRCRGEAI